MSILAPNSHMLYRGGEGYQSENQNQIRTGIGCGSALTKPYAFGCGRGDWKKKKKQQQQLLPERRGLIRVNAVWPDSRHDIVEMQPITDCEHLDQILEHAKQLSQPILIDWKAAWCRKCIYLKPKLEKLAAEYDTKMKFYCVDVNNVPQALVKRGNISKMPTIQLWKDGVMKEEVIGGHKAWLVIDEVRAMIQKFV